MAATVALRRVPGRWLGCFGFLLLGITLTRAERLPLRSYTSNDGLPSTVILRIVPDSRGFLWFCTRDGLSRFDGQEFVNYGMEDGLTDPTINNLLEARDGVYWVATNGGGVCRFDPSHPTGAESGKALPVFQCQPVGDTLLSNRVNVLFEAREGRIWAGTDGGLFRLDQNSNGFRPIRPVGVTDFSQDEKGNLWITGGERLMQHLPDGTWVDYAVSPPDAENVNVQAILFDRGGRMWLGTPRGLAMLESTSQLEEGAGNTPSASTIGSQAQWYTTRDGLLDNDIRALLEASDGRIWIATSGGISELHQGVLRSYGEAQGLTNRTPARLAVDQDGNLWIGGENGADKLIANGLTSYSLPTAGSGLGQDERVHAIFEGRPGEIFAVSGDWVISRFDGQGVQSVQANIGPLSLRRYASQVAFLDSSGQWWMLTDEGLYRYQRFSSLRDLAHTRPIDHFDRSDGLAGDVVFRLFEDAEKNIWISSRGGPGQNGLARWDRSAGTFHHYSQEDGFPQGKAPSAFCQDQLGSIWIGFYLGGLTRRTSGRFQTFGPENGLPEGGITALYVDSAGRLWIGSQNAGLARLDDVEMREPVFIPYTTRQGLSSNNVRALTEDEWGRLYIGTARGVDRLDPKTDLIRHFTAQDGLANSFVTTALRDSQGQLWFGTADGVSRFRAQSEPLRSPPPIWIAGLQVAGVAQAISLLGETAIADLVLPPDQDQIQINFSSLGFAAGERIRYQFRLEGTDQGWSDPTDQRSVNFARLAPGSYRFLVRAINSDGQVSSQPATVAFTVLAPLWRRWWVLALAGLAMASLAYVGYRYRISRLLELERVRTRIASDLHDDIGAGLSQISLQSELVKRQIESAGPGPQQMLTQIAETSRDLVDTMSDLVWSIDPRRNDIKSLTARLRQVASNLLDVREINWQLRVADPAQNLKIGPEQRRHLILIIKETLNNIVRHSGCVSASLDLKGTVRELLLEIRDDGCGFSHSDSMDSDLEVQGNGLRNIRARAEDLGAELRINSSPGRGTTLKLRLPL